MALRLNPGSESCLGELLKAVSDNPDHVLEYSSLVSGGGVCRYRLAKAELKLNIFQGESLRWLLQRYQEEDSTAAADAGCWLSLLFPSRGLEYIERAVDLAPDVVFYRYILIDKLIESDMLNQAEEEFFLLHDSCDTGFWQAAASLHQAQGKEFEAVQDLRMAYNLCRTPSTGGNLGWRLYFLGRDLAGENRIQEAVPFLIQCSGTWNPESTWAVRADSLLNQLNEFTSISDGFGEPL